MTDICNVKTLGEIRKEYILKVLRETRWDFRKASRILNVSEEFLKKEVKRTNLLADAKAKER